MLDLLFDPYVLGEDVEKLCMKDMHLLGVVIFDHGTNRLIADLDASTNVIVEYPGRSLDPGAGTGGDDTSLPIKLSGKRQVTGVYLGRSDRLCCVHPGPSLEDSLRTKLQILDILKGHVTATSTWDVKLRLFSYTTSYAQSGLCVRPCVHHTCHDVMVPDTGTSCANEKLLVYTRRGHYSVDAIGTAIVAAPPRTAANQHKPVKVYPVSLPGETLPDRDGARLFFRAAVFLSMLLRDQTKYTPDGTCGVPADMVVSCNTVGNDEVWAHESAAFEEALNYFAVRPSEALDSLEQVLTTVAEHPLEPFVERILAIRRRVALVTLRMLQGALADPSTGTLPGAHALFKQNIDTMLAVIMTNNLVNNDSRSSVAIRNIGKERLRTSGAKRMRRDP
jgi:hypothetical protein